MVAILAEIAKTAEIATLAISAVFVSHRRAGGLSGG